MVGVRVCEGREGDMNPRKLVLVVVWGCLFMYATSVGIPAKDTLSLTRILATLIHIKNAYVDEDYEQI